MLLLSITSDVTAQHVVETSRGIIEFVGLEKWSPDRIQKELKLASKDDLHYCARLLKTELNFPDASVFTYRNDSLSYKVISVVEPQNADFVKFKPAPRGDIPVPAGWMTVIDAAGINYGQDFSFGLLSYGDRYTPNYTDSTVMKTDWMKSLRELTRPEDYRTAFEIIKQDSSRSKRIAAAGVLMNFPEYDQTWHALMSGLRDSEDMVIASSMHSLQIQQTFHLKYYF